MSATEVAYEHQPVSGLPRSLIQLQDGTVAVIALMQRHAGLNRDRRRDLPAVPKVHDEIPKPIAKVISKTDWKVLPFYLSAGWRFSNFWRVVWGKLGRKGGVDGKTFALAVDWQLLSAYEPGWTTLELNEEALSAACPEWPRIKESIAQYWKGPKERMPHGVFMLWPRLVDELARWDQLAPEQQVRVGHAVFSLSSIGRTRWFIDEALARCPALEDELGALRTANRSEQSGAGVPPVPNEEDEDVEAGDGKAADATDEAPLDVPTLWASLGAKLSELQTQWQGSPERELVVRLVELGAEASSLLALMPEVRVSAREALNDALAALRARLQDVANGEGLSWLTHDDRASIMARWSLAALDAPDDEAVHALIKDATRAFERLDAASAEFRSSILLVEDAKRTVAELEGELTRQTSAVRRIDFTKRLQQAKADELAAERKCTDVMLFVLASASPYGEAYDAGVDYVAKLGARSNEDPGSVRPESEPELSITEPSEPSSAQPVPLARQTIDEAPDPQKTSADEESSLQNEATIETPAPEPHKPVAEPESASSAASVPDSQPTGELTEASQETTPALPSAPSDQPVSAPSAPSAPVVHLKTQEPFSDAAGEQCRPIWALLGMGRPALAYHFARALQTEHTDLHVPPPALLRSVALAPGLAASDGPLAMAIAEAFGDIEAGWFEPGEAPSDWQTALNLLLIAATLRPMVLAPAIGATAIAGFRHLDGRHAALLELVRKISEVSEPLTGFSMGPAVLRSVADQTSQKLQLAKLSKDAEEWLHDRAPNKKIRYAPASKVWLYWLKPGEPIHRLVSPVARGALDERNAVRLAIDEFSNYDHFLDRLSDTDRRQLNRRGQDIEAGALEHLWVATCEAVALAKDWLAATGLLTESGGRLRALIGQLHAAFEMHADAACAELDRPWGGDGWGQVSAASRVLRDEVRALARMFMQSDAIPGAEPQAKELLARDLLWVPGVSVSPAWVVASQGDGLLRALKSWSETPVDASEAFKARLQAGDLAGAEQLLPHMSSADDDSMSVQALERARDLWARDLQKGIQQARRASEVGLAYGYLSDAERAWCEGELSVLELSLRDIVRFDDAFARIRAVNKKIEEQKSRRVDEARQAFENERANLTPDVCQQLIAPLDRSDVHTFNELLHRVRQGAEPWPERDSKRDAFCEFYPKVQSELQAMLARMDPAEIDKLIRRGAELGGLSFDLEGDEQSRQEAEQVYGLWATARSRRSLSRESLRRILEALGFQVRALDADKMNAGWVLESVAIEDRDVCAVPHFGSRAQGRYRVVVLAEHLTPEDLILRVGENTQQVATIVLMLARVSRAQFWVDLSRLSKERQRSFLVLEESMLLFLLAQRGSRLATWFSLAMPFTYSEPYDASAGFVPPEMFYGRTYELESVKAPGGCYFIYGGRQLGKTALLRRAEKTFHDPTADRYALWVDTLAQGIGERRPAADVWLSVSERLRELKIPGLDLPPVNPAKSASIDALLSAIKSFLAAKPTRRILLLLDEADHFFEHDGRQASSYAETRRLKRLMDETERRFKVVFAGLHNVLRTASTSNQPLGHLNEAVQIGPLMANDREIRAAEQLITRPIEAAGYEFEDRSLVMRILAQTNYYPSLIQLYCTQLLRYLRETKLKGRGVVGPRFRIDETDIDSVFSGRPLRDAIRSKFRLTLQLDDRYEVIANAIGLEASASGFDHAQGIEWRKIWDDCRTVYWPEGFAKTTERDFLVLLEEMVQLGVLSEAKNPERFSLRNPNVLLLLGSKQEIESTLQAEREPRIDFESTIFRPALGGRMDDPARNPLTYRQLDEVVQMRSAVQLVAASEAAGGSHLLRGLREQPGAADNRLFVVLDRATDKRSFSQELDKEVKKRVADGITVMFVPAAVPWDAEWVTAARAKLNALKSVTSFVSVVFAADPRRLWALSADGGEQAPWLEPWLSVLPWERGFVRKWLEELQLPTDSVDRLKQLTGCWGGLLESAARVRGDALDFAANLERMGKLATTTEWQLESRRRLTSGIEEADRVLSVMAGLGDGVTAGDLVEFGELPEPVVAHVLRWGEPLGLLARQPGAGWAMDPFLRSTFADVLP